MSFDYASIDLRSVNVTTGVIAAGAGADSEILQVRWTGTNQRLVVPFLRMSVVRAGTAFTAGAATFRVAKATGWSVAGTGGNTVTLTGANGKLDTVINGQTLPEIRYASTAALGAGTKTILQDMGGVAVGVPGTVTFDTIVAESDLYSDLLVVARPIILNTQEGLTVRATVPATGTWTANFTLAYGVV